MNKEQLKEHIFNTYGINSDTPFKNDTETKVFRHPNNKKWFAIMMNVKKRSLSINEDGSLCIINLKTDFNMISSLLSEKGFYPAYHMNKEHWISVAVEEADEEKIKLLIDISYEKTMPKIKNKGAHNGKI